MSCFGTRFPEKIASLLPTFLKLFQFAVRNRSLRFYLAQNGLLNSPICPKFFPLRFNLMYLETFKTLKKLKNYALLCVLFYKIHHFLKVDPLGLYLQQHMFYKVYVDTISGKLSKVLHIRKFLHKQWMSVKREVEAFMFHNPLFPEWEQGLSHLLSKDCLRF